MSEHHSGKAGQISWVVVLVLLAATGVASLCLWWLGNWDEYAWGLTLTLRILWGVWIVAAFVTLLTHVTIFGWSFRRYVRWAGDKMPDWSRFRPATAPWSKSGKVSFSFTVIIVWFTAAIVIASVVMWILELVTGDWIFWLVFKILWASWWVVMIGLVLTRVIIFGIQRRKQLGSDSSELPS